MTEAQGYRVSNSHAKRSKMPPKNKQLHSAAVPARPTFGEIFSLTFNSDHRDPQGKKLLRKATPKAVTIEGQAYNSVYSEENSLEMPKPDWLGSANSQRNDPITHTAGQRIYIDAEIKFKNLPGGKAILKRIYTDSQIGAFQFDVGQNSKAIANNETVKLSNVISKNNCWSIVGRFDGTIKWLAEIDGLPSPVFLGYSGPHTVFTTISPPSGQAEWELITDVNGQKRQHFAERGNKQIVTISRIEFACRAAQGASNQKDIADRVFQYLKNPLNVNYMLQRQWLPQNERRPDSYKPGVTPYPTLEHYLWLCNIDKARGECHVIAAAFRLICRMLGVTDPMEVGYMMPLPGRLESPPNYPRRIGTLKGKLNVQSKRTPLGTLAFFDGNGSPNQFEGVVIFQKGLYAIGDAIFDRFPKAKPDSGDPIDGTDEDKNASDYFTLRAIPKKTDIRSKITDHNAGLFDLAWVDNDGKLLPIQYPWKTMPNGQPNMSESQMFRWED